MRLQHLTESPVRAALAACRSHLYAAAAFSAASNILYLAPSLFMLQVYDRVVPSGGLVSLASIGLLTLAALATLGLFEALRSRLLIRISARLEVRLAGEVLTAAMSRPDLDRLHRAQLIHDFDKLRQGIASGGIIALLDWPWTVIYVIAAFLLHPALGAMTIAAGVVLLLLAWRAERATATPMKQAGEAASLANARQSHATAYAAEVRALGMVEALTRLQAHERGVSNRLQMGASFAAAFHSGIVKFVRLAMQSAVLALGAVLVIDNSISAGSMIAASLLMARALAPIEHFVGSWKSVAQTRAAFTRLNASLERPVAGHKTMLPAPTGSIQVERLTVLTPLSERIALAEANFDVKPGEIIGIVGPSGAGKSTLIRAMAGAIQPTRGHIRFAGSAREDWQDEQLARHIGYLPQEPVLFAGSIKDNISRFRQLLDGDHTDIDAAVIRAAMSVGAHDMIVRLPDGYNTLVATGGVGLSGGQAQQIALARAMFGDPIVLLLDEPTSALDAEGQLAFVALLRKLRERHATVLYVSHATEALAAADKLLVLSTGQVRHFAPNQQMSPGTTTLTVRPPTQNRVMFQ